jgi:putative aminopeptidase FrvX
MTLLRLLEEIGDQAPVSVRPLIIAFTVHEEGGCHGAKVLAQRERPEIFVAVDGCPTPPEAPLRLDGRPAVWSQDTLGHFDQRLVQALRQCAREAGTELQVAVYEHSAGDASAAYAVGAVPRAAHVGHVRENSHGYEVARLSVFDNLLKTLARFVRTL